MPLNNAIKEKISIEVIKTLITRFSSFPEDASNNRNAPFHESFLRAFADKLSGKISDTPFFISLSSWLQGLNTTLGQSFFENIANVLCDGEKKEYTSKKLGNLQITQSQRELISDIIANLSNATVLPNLSDENRRIFMANTGDTTNAWDFTADIFFEREESIIAIELKSVKPNSGEMRGEKQKILEGKAALSNLFPGKEINFYIAFPFDPTVNPNSESKTSCNKTRFLSSIINMNKFFAQDETLIADELWNFLSLQENTMEEIIDIINVISTTGFLSKFQLLMDNTKRLTEEYVAQLQEWNLYSEKELIENNDIILQKINNDNTGKRQYKKMLFDNNGNYNWNRYHYLKSKIYQRELCSPGGGIDGK